VIYQHAVGLCVFLISYLTLLYSPGLTIANVVGFIAMVVFGHAIRFAVHGPCQSYMRYFVVSFWLYMVLHRSYDWRVFRLPYALWGSRDGHLFATHCLFAFVTAVVVSCFGLVCFRRESQAGHHHARL
jgi:hypothetical protein